MSGPHDRFFRYIFGTPAQAGALLRHNLSAASTGALDWSSLKRESGTLVDWDRETRKDLLFSARWSHSPEDAPPHFFLIEHQSSVDRWMALRMLDYSWRLIQHWREAHPQSSWIPEVTPLVVYPRQGRRWSAPLRLEDHYRVTAEAGRRRRWSLRSEYRVDDLSLQSEEAVRARPGPALMTLGLLVLRFADTGQLAHRLPHWSELFTQVYTSAQGPRMVYRVVRYLHQLGDERAHAAVRRVLHSIMESNRAEAIMKTMAEVLKEQGRQIGLAQGEAKGEAKGLAKALLRLLEAKGIRVDDSSRQRIQSCTEVSILERWHERALSATRLSEVLDAPTQ